jgi:hypothetical protein
MNKKINGTVNLNELKQIEKIDNPAEVGDDVLCFEIKEYDYSKSPDIVNREFIEAHKLKCNTDSAPQYFLLDRDYIEGEDQPYIIIKLGYINSKFVLEERINFNSYEEYHYEMKKNEDKFLKLSYRGACYLEKTTKYYMEQYNKRNI